MAKKKIVTSTLQVPVNFTSNNPTEVLQSINKIKNELKLLSEKNKDLSGAKNLLNDLKKVEAEVQKTIVNNSGKKIRIDLDNHTIEDIKNLNKQLRDFSNSTDYQIAKINKSFNSLTTPIYKADTALSKFGHTLFNSLRYNIANEFVDFTWDTVSGTIQYLKDSDKYLNKIRIVSSKAQDEMKGFLKTANTSAKEMGEITGKYLRASEIYYQQGLATNEIITRTESTIKAANVSGQDVKSTSSQITAVLNGFNISANKTTETLDKMAAVGAGTATDFQEIAKASQKMASAASNAGLSIDESLGMIATISSVTREAPESVGTSVNAIIARYNDLSAKKGEYVSLIEKELKATNSGLSIFDKESGQLKKLSTLLDELLVKWDDLDKNQKSAITSAIAGSRQANRLLALLNNADLYKSYTEMAKDSEGALEEQNQIYLQSLEAIEKQTQATKEGLYDELFDVETLKKWNKFLTKTLEILTKIVEKGGGLTGIITPLIALARTGVMSKIGPSIFRGYQKRLINNRENQENKLNERREMEAQGRSVGLDFKLLTDREISQNLTDHDITTYNTYLETIKKEIIERKKLGALKKEALVLDDKELDKETRRARLAENTAQTEIQEVLKKNKQIFKNFDNKGTRPLVRGKNAVLHGIYNKRLNATNVKRLEAEGLLPQGVQVGSTATYQDIVELARMELSTVENELSNTNLKDLVKKKLQSYADNLRDIIKIINKYSNLGIENLGLGKGLISDNSNKQMIGSLFNKDSKILKGYQKNFTSDEWTTLLNLKDAYDEGDLSEDELLKKIDSSKTKKVLEKLRKIGQEKNVEVRQQQKKVNGGSEEATKAKDFINRMKDGTKLTTGIDMLSKGLVGLAGSLQIVKTASNEALEPSEKLVGSLSGLGTILMAFPATAPLGIALSTLIPVLTELFHLGESDFDRFNRKIQTTKESLEELTQSVTEERQQLKPVKGVYEELVKKYNTTDFSYEKLNEAEKNSYNQVAEYAEKYAPALIKYYDEEGQAVLDLTDKYGDLDKNKKNALEKKLEQDELLTYSSLSDKTGENTRNLLGLQQVAISKVADYRQKIQAKRQEALEGKDVGDELIQLQEKLATYQQSLGNIHRDWDELFTKIVTKGTKEYYGLSTAIKDSIKSASSYSNFLETDMKMSTSIFEDSIKNLIYSLSQLGEKQSEVLSNMGQDSRNSLFEILSKVNLGISDNKDILNKIEDEENIYDGVLFNEILERININRIARNKELIDNINNTFGENYNTNPADVDSIIKELRDKSEAETKRVQINNNALSMNNAYNNGVGIPTEVGLSKPYSPGETTYSSTTPSIEPPEVEKTWESRKKEAEEGLNWIDKMSVDLEDGFKTQEEVFTETISLMADSLLELSEKGPEAFNKIADSFNKMNERLKAEGAEPLAKKLGFDKVEELEEYMGAMYAALNADNKTYFKEWKYYNAEAIDSNMENLGIYVNNYETYNEYMDAVNAELAQRKILYETLANKGVSEAVDQMQRYKIKKYSEELIQSGDLAKAKIFLAETEEKQKEIIGYQDTKNKLTQYKDQVDAAIKANQADLTAEKAKYNKSLNMSAQYINSMITTLNNSGIKTSMVASIGGEVAKVTEDTTLRDIQKSLADEIERNQKAIDSLLKEPNKNSSQKEIDELVDFLGGKNNKYNYGFKDNYKNIVLKDFTKPKKNNKLTKGDNNTGKSGSEVEDLDFKINLLKLYEEKIKDINHQLNLLKNQKEKLYGAQYIQVLNKEAILEKEKLKVNQQILKEIDKITQKKKKALSGNNIKYTDYGAISNYNEILQAQEKYVNSLSGEAKKQAKKQAEDLKNAMDDYEKYALEKTKKAKEDIEEVRMTLIKLAKERIEYGVGIIVEISKKDETYLDFIKSVEEYKKGKIHFTIDVDSTANQVIDKMSTIQKIFKELGDSRTFLNKINTDNDLRNSPKAQLELITGQQEKLQSLGKELINFSNKFKESFAGALDEAIKIFNEELKKFDNIILQYNRILEISKKLNLLDFNNINVTYEKIENVYTNNLLQYKKMVNNLKESRDSFEIGSEDWITANTKYLDMQVKYLDEQKKLTDLMEKRYDTTVSTGREEIEKLLFGNSTSQEVQDSFNKINKEREKYLDTEEKIYSLSKFERDIQKDIDNYVYDAETQKTLENFMREELKFLKDKKKITEDDLTLSKKQYNVFKARIDLERSYNSEQYSLMLQRREDGTFGYMYVQNTDEIKKAQQAYEDSVNELYKYSVERNKKLQQESIDIRNDALKEYDKIANKLKNGTIDQEQAVKMLNQAFDEMKKKLQENAKAQAEVEKQIASSKLLQILGVSETELGNLSNQASSLKTIFDILSNNGEVENQTISNLIKNLGLEANTYVGSVGEQISQIFKDLGGDDGAMQKILEQFNDMNKATAATVIGLLRKTGDLSILTKDILQNSLSGSGEKFEEFLNKISSDTVKPEDLFTESMKNGLNNVEDIWDSLKEKINVDLDTFEREFDIENPESLLGQVSNNIVQAYEKYNKALEDSYETLKKNQEDLDKTTSILNKDLNNTVSELQKEINEVTKVTLKYGNLRKEILKAIEEVTKYINNLNTARKKIEQNNASVEKASRKQQQLSSQIQSNKRAAQSLEKELNDIKKDIAKTQKEIDKQKHATTTKPGAGNTFGGGVGNKVQRYHSGGGVDINHEGYAILKKNEAVLTESQVATVKSMKEILESITSSFKGRLVTNFNLPVGNEQIEQKINIQANFPNATDKDSIKEALETLYINSSQYLNKE